jgi:hypothetical protein
MEQRFLIQSLNRNKVKAYAIASQLNIGEQVVHDILDEELEAIRNIEKDYYEHEWPRVMKHVREMQNDISKHEQHEMRRRYLLNRIQELKPKYLETQSPELHRELSALLFETKVFTGKITGTTPETIDRARQYPLTNLVKSRNGMAICPFHNEKTPSLNIKNNFYFCHGCGESGDTISFVMKRDNLRFPEAVAKLTSPV